MRILLITSGLSRLVQPLIASSHDLVGVLESSPRDYKKSSVLFRGLSWVYRLFYSSNQSLECFSNGRGLPYRLMYSSEDIGLEDWVRSCEPDIIVVFSMSRLLKENIFNIPKNGTINLHPSFLPEYRGPNPDFWQYYNMEMNPGVTVHYIDRGEDTGDIIYQDTINIELGMKSPQRLDFLIGDVGVGLVIKALDDIQEGTAPRLPQSQYCDTKRARNLLPEEHKSIIDWKKWPVEKVWHVLRGTELWLNALPAPSGFNSGQRWTVQGFDKNVRDSDVPGNIYLIYGRKYVAAKDGKIFLTINFSITKLIVGLIT